MSPYGPAPSPQQIDVAASPGDLPEAWAVTIAVGLAITALAWPLRRRPALAAGIAALGQTVALTAPLLVLLPRAVYGDWPTIDKQGSLLFYLEGVHRHMAAHPFDLADYAPARLIGLHVGHLWVTEAFDLFLEPFAAMNAQGLLYLVLAWWCAWGFLKTVGGDARVAFALAFPYALGLHTFRDLDGYTVEKAAIFALPLYGTCWLRTVREGGGWRWLAAGVVLLATLLNLYLGLVITLAAAVATGMLLIGGISRARHAGKPLRSALAARSSSWLAGSYAVTGLMLVPIALVQASLLTGGRSLASPECFLWQRAALDVVTLWPPAWNRLEPWAALNPLALALALWGLGRAREPLVAGLLTLGASMAAISLGPELAPGVTNPVYMALWHALPFFWRIAKPEVFFFVTWLCLLAIAAWRWSEARPSAPQVALGYALMVVVWVATVRVHPAYPGFTAYQASKLAPGWEARLEGQAACVSPRGASPP